MCSKWSWFRVDADGYSNLGSDFEQLQTNRLALCFRRRGAGKPYASGWKRLLCDEFRVELFLTFFADAMGKHHVELFLDIFLHIFPGVVFVTYLLAGSAYWNKSLVRRTFDLFRTPACYASCYVERSLKFIFFVKKR